MSNKHSAANSKRNGQSPPTHLPPLPQRNQPDLRAHFFDARGEALSKGSSRRFGAAGAAGQDDELQDAENNFMLNVTNRMGDQESATIRGMKNRDGKTKKKKFQTDRPTNLFENIMPAPDVINQELMNHFGGRELTEMHEIQQFQRMTTLSNQMMSQANNDKQSRKIQAQLEAHSCMSVQSPDKLPKYNPL
jgi:hypothetical protein